MLGLYKGISSHSFDDMEPFVPMMDSSNLIKAQVGKAQAAQDFQDIPLSVKVADAVRTSLGMYFKFYVDISECASEETVTTASLPAGTSRDPPRDAVKYTPPFTMLVFMNNSLVNQSHKVRLFNTY